MSDATVFCNQCGQAVNAAASFCTRCQGALSPVIPGMPVAGVTSAGIPVRQYGGFWIRVVASIIDGAVTNIVTIPIFVVLFGGYFATHHPQDGQPPDAGFFVLVALVVLFIMVGVWLYDALMTSSSKQGTLGKMVMRLKVTDMNGGRISFGRATGRHFAKVFLSGIMMIGYIMAAFTDRKQALHDMVAGTLVRRS